MATNLVLEPDMTFAFTNSIHREYNAQPLYEFTGTNRSLRTTYSGDFKVYGNTLTFTCTSKTINTKVQDFPESVFTAILIADETF